MRMPVRWRQADNKILPFGFPDRRSRRIVRQLVFRLFLLQQAHLQQLANDAVTWKAKDKNVAFYTKSRFTPKCATTQLIIDLPLSPDNIVFGHRNWWTQKQARLTSMVPNCHQTRELSWPRSISSTRSALTGSPSHAGVCRCPSDSIHDRNWSRRIPSGIFRSVSSGPRWKAASKELIFWKKTTTWNKNYPPLTINGVGWMISPGKHGYPDSSNRPEIYDDGTFKSAP